jgi:hypothetical protein
LSALHGVEISVGSISALQGQVSAAVAAPVETAREFARQQAANNVERLDLPVAGLILIKTN